MHGSEFASQLPLSEKIHDYFRDFLRSQVGFGLTLRFQRAQRICPVIIRGNEWEDLSHSEKIPFLERIIQEAFREGQTYHPQELDFL